MICNFTSLSTVFQAYQDNGGLIMKDYVQEASFTAEKISPPAGIELDPLDQ